MLQSVDLCPNCNVVANSGLSKCAAGHTYCYNCACVIGDGDAAYVVSESSFCPLCAEPLKDIAPPDEYVCPITHELMVKPVVASDGFSYERSAIEDWVRHKGLRIVIIFEGRDTAGKGGVIKRITAMLNPRFCRIAALPAPSCVRSALPVCVNIPFVIEYEIRTPSAGAGAKATMVAVDSGNACEKVRLHP